MELPEGLLATINKELLRGERVMLIGKKEYKPGWNLFALPFWFIVAACAWCILIPRFNNLAPHWTLQFGSLIAVNLPWLAILVSIGILIFAVDQMHENIYYVLTDDRIMVVNDKEVKEIGKRSEIVKYEAQSKHVTLKLSDGTCAQLAVISKPSK
jgi:hypothetical protein